MRTRTFASLAGAALAVMSPAARAQDEAGLETFVAEGSVGAYRAGLNLTIKDRVQVVAAHYYYESTGKDIPLAVTQAADKLTLDEPGGGRMVVALANSDASAPRPLNFGTSTGLTGTWTGAGKVLPVRFGFGTVLSGPAPVRWYGDVTRDSDAAFERRVRGFVSAARARDCRRAAAFVSYPLRINGRSARTIRNGADFARQCASILTPGLAASLKDAIAHEMFVRDGQAMVAGGAVWFDAKGAVALNLP